MAVQIEALKAFRGQPANANCSWPAAPCGAVRGAAVAALASTCQRGRARRMKFFLTPPETYAPALGPGWRDVLASSAARHPLGRSDSNFRQDVQEPVRVTPRTKEAS